MMDIDKDACYLIRKQGYWYRPNSQGYTSSAVSAGRYTKDEAECITHPNGPDGPRDGMNYVHVDDVVCDDLRAFRALSAQLEAVKAESDNLRKVVDQYRENSNEQFHRANKLEATLPDPSIREYFAAHSPEPPYGWHYRDQRHYETDLEYIFDRQVSWRWEYADAMMSFPQTQKGKSRQQPHVSSSIRDEAMEEAAKWHDEVARHDLQGMEYSSSVGIGISNWAELDLSAKTHEWCAKEIRALKSQEAE